MFSNPGVGCQVSASALPVDDLCLLITAHGSLRSRRRQQTLRLLRIEVTKGDESHPAVIGFDLDGFMSRPPITKD
jgi:hypothetical protein